MQPKQPRGRASSLVPYTVQIGLQNLASGQSTNMHRAYPARLIMPCELVRWQLVIHHAGSGRRPQDSGELPG